MYLYDASIDGIPLEIETMDDQFEVAIGRHEMPYKDGALLENMGQKARVISLRCYFWDTAGHLTFNDHIKLINHLRNQQLFELIHPIYGSITGMVERVSCRADDRELTAEVDVTFVENLRQEISEIQYEDVETAADQAVVDAQAEQMDEFEKDTRTDLGAEAADINNRELNPDLGILEQFTTISLQARAWVAAVEESVTLFEGVLADVTQPANTLIAAITYGTRLPGRVIGAIARMVDRYVALYATTTNAPSRFLNSLDNACANLLGVSDIPANLRKHLRVAFATQGAHAAARYFAADESSRQILRRLEKQAAFDTMGCYLNPPQAAPVYTVNELEQALANSRNQIQAAIDDGGRDIASLKAMARILVDHVSGVKLEREKIVTVTLDNPMPLHIVCLRYGLDYHYADRIIAINVIAQPNITSGRLQIYLPPGATT